MMNKMTKWAITPFLVGSLIFPQLAHAEESAISVLLNNTQVTFDQDPVIDGDITLVPLRGIFEKIGAVVNWENNKVIATKEDVNIELIIGSKIAVKDNKTISLNTPPIIINGRVMVPIRFVSESLGAEVSWNKSNRTIIITTESQIEKQNSNEDNVRNELTIDSAIKNAISNSFQLKNSNKEIEKAEEIQSNYGDYFYVMTPGGGGNSPQEAQLSQIYLGSLSAQDKLKIAKLDQKTKEEEVEYSVKKAYNEVAKKEFEQKVALQTLNLEKLNLEIGKVQLKQGVISIVAFEQLENKLAEKQETLELAEKRLKEARVVLNQIMGKGLENVYWLVDNPQFHTLDNVNIEYKVATVMENDPRIFKLEKNKELAEKAVSLYTYNSGSVEDSYKTRQLDAVKASNQLADTKQTIIESVHSIYLNIKSLEDQYKILKVNYDNLEKNFKVAKTEYEVGKNTELNLKQIEVQLIEVQKQILDLLVQLDNLHMLYEKPWLSTIG